MEQVCVVTRSGRRLEYGDWREALGVAFTHYVLELLEQEVFDLVGSGYVNSFHHGKSGRRQGLARHAKNHRRASS